MSKFIFEGAVIDKSEKDIITGVRYDFKENMNIICGNNEAGKSSLMQFLKDGLFRKNGTDAGRIYFIFSNMHYRADIKYNRRINLRCTIFDDKNRTAGYDIIERTINRNYFEQGFTINLDDLAGIQNKDTQALINAIKDPNCEKLGEYYQIAFNKAKKIYGENNRLTKEAGEILDKINDINQEIKSKSDNEDKYNKASADLEGIKDKISLLEKQEKKLLLIKDLMYISAVADKIIAGENPADIERNENLNSGSNKYLKLQKVSEKLNTNRILITKNTDKINSLAESIKNEIAEINNIYSADLTFDEIEKFDIKQDDINKIKNFLSELEKIQKELISNNTKKEAMEENIIKLKNDKLYSVKKLLSNGEYQKLKELHLFLSDNLAQYNSILSQISGNKNDILSCMPDARIFYALLMLNAVTIFSAVFSYNTKYYFQCISALTAVVIIMSGVYFFRKLKLLKEKNLFAENLDLKKNNLLNNMKIKAKEYNSDIEKTDDSISAVKLETIKQEIQLKLDDYKKLSEQADNIEKEISFNLSKSASLNVQNDSDNNKISRIKSDMEKILKDNGINTLIKPENIILFISGLKKIKSGIKDKNNLEEENLLLKKETVNLINDLKEQKKDISEELSRYKTENIELELENNKSGRNSLIKEKENLEYIKRSLEEYKGISNIKHKKNILLEEYRAKIFELLKQKLITKIIERTKSNFNKNQPDVKNAGKYLSLLTNEKYSEINLDLEEIQNAGGTKIKKWMELSRGTKEQLYLSLRLGYAVNYSKDRITMHPNGKPDLPVIIDDAFVNFDKIRTINALKCLMEFSKTNQVILFTCRNDYIDILKTLGEVNIIRL